MGEEKQEKYYVSMTDTFMSGWGEARNKISKLIFLCDTLEEAQIVKDNAEQRSDQKYVNIHTEKPYYNKDRYHTQIKTKGDYNSWYVKNLFRKQRYAEEAL